VAFQYLQTLAARGAKSGDDVSKKLTAWISAILLLRVFFLPALAADEAALSRDLTAVIAAQGLKCGKIVKIRTQADGDYLVACQDGSNYQIIADAQGKLEAHPLGMKIH
jgi:hypothetical protein